MLQFMGSQRVRYNLVNEQQQQIRRKGENRFGKDTVVLSGTRKVTPKSFRRKSKPFFRFLQASRI